MEHQELRELLENLRVDATDVQPNDSATLQQLLTRALEKAQRLSEKYTERGGLNLGTLDRCRPDLEMVSAFTYNRTLQEILNVASGKDDTKDVYYQFRESLGILAMNWHKLRQANTSIQDADQSIGIMLQIRGLRKLPDGTPLFEVQYQGGTKEEFQRDKVAQQAVARTVSKADNGQMMNMKVAPAEAMLFMQVLRLNAQKLSPEYLEQCKRKWSMEPTFEVSFLVPARVLTPDESEKVQKKCANSSCGKPASRTCSRCKVAYYCCRDCQTAHWQQHKRPCKQHLLRATADAGSTTQPDAMPAEDEEAGTEVEADGEEQQSGSVEVCVTKAAREHEGLYGFSMPLHRPLNESLRHYREHGEMAGSKQMLADMPPPPNVHGKKRFLVKVQVGLDDPFSPLMLYDEKRTIHTYIGQEQYAHAILYKTVSTKGYQGAKAYFWSRRVSNSTVRIFLEDRPANKPFW